MLCKAEWSWELQTWSHKMNLLDISSTSPHYFYGKWIGATNENSNVDLRVKRVKRTICFCFVLFHSISCVILGFPFLEWKWHFPWLGWINLKENVSSTCKRYKQCTTSNKNNEKKRYCFLFDYFSELWSFFCCVWGRLRNYFGAQVKSCSPSEKVYVNEVP